MTLKQVFQDIEIRTLIHHMVLLYALDKKDNHQHCYRCLKFLWHSDLFLFVTMTVFVKTSSFQHAVPALIVKSTLPVIFETHLVFQIIKYTMPIPALTSSFSSTEKAMIFSIKCTSNCAQFQLGLGKYLTWQGELRSPANLLVSPSIKISYPLHDT